MEALLTCVSRPLLVRGLQYPPSPSPAAPSPTREKSLKKETSFIWSLLSLLLHLLLFWLLLTLAPWTRSDGGVSGNSIQENIRIKTKLWYIKLFTLLTFIWVNSQKHYWFGIKLVNIGNNSLIPNCYSCLKVGKPWFFSPCTLGGWDEETGVTAHPYDGQRQAGWSPPGSGMSRVVKSNDSRWL